MAQAIARDRDIRVAMRDLMMATGEFDGVYLSGATEDYGRAAGETRTAWIEPWSWRSDNTLGDAADECGLLVDAVALITFCARHEDPQIRDELAERLIMIAANVLSPESLAGITLTQRGGMDSYKFRPPSPPERRVEAHYSYTYIVEGNANFNTEE